MLLIDQIKFLKCRAVNYVDSLNKIGFNNEAYTLCENLI